MILQIDLFLSYLRAVKNYSEKTISSYRCDLLALAEFMQNKLQHNPVISDLNRLLLRDYLRSLKSRQLSNRTYNRQLAAFKSFSKYLIKYKIIKTDFTANLNSLQLPDRLPSFLPEDKMDRVIDNLRENDFFDSRESLIVELFYGTGIRLSELIALKLSDFNQQERLLSVTGKGRKQRIVPFSPFIADKIELYQQWRDETMQANGKQHDYLVVSIQGNRISSRQVQRIVGRVLDHISGLSKTSPHVLRHTFATHLLNSGADIASVKTLLGHESLSATQVYTHLTSQRMQNIYKKAFPKAD